MRERQPGGDARPARRARRQRRQEAQPARRKRLVLIQRPQRVGQLAPDRPGDQQRLRPLLHQRHRVDPNRRLQLDGARQRERVEARVAGDVAGHDPRAVGGLGHPDDLVGGDRGAARRGDAPLSPARNRPRPRVPTQAVSPSSSSASQLTAAPSSPSTTDQRCPSKRNRPPGPPAHTPRVFTGRRAASAVTSPGEPVGSKRQPPALPGVQRPLSAALATQASPSSSTASAVSPRPPTPSRRQSPPTRRWRRPSGGDPARRLPTGSAPWRPAP